MKFKLTVILAACVITMGLLLGTSAAQEAEVIFDPNDTDRATGITNLVVDGTPYNVTFTAYTTAAAIYSEFPGVFDFITIDSAAAALDAVNAELIEQGADGVGADSSEFDGFYRIGFASEQEGEVQSVTFWEGINNTGSWVRVVDPDIDAYNLGERVWADFTLVEPGPEPESVLIGGNVTGLEGSGLVLQNNGIDDLIIEVDGVFTFVTPLIPGTSYNVTVATDPSDPAQTCTVDNGSGQVPTADITDVAVSCTEGIVGDVIKIAAEGDTLADGTLLKQIVLDGGVAININGKVAFGGRDDNSTIAVFTQDELVAKEGGTLADGTEVSDISPFGEVAISAGQSADRLAFHGRTGNDKKAVFNQAGLVAKEGDTLADGNLLDKIKDHGKVATNDFDIVAFHGIIKIEAVDDLSDTETFNAVFNSDGLVVREGSELSDLTIVQAIDETGGLAINDFGDVAFHGDVVDPDAGGDAVKAVFTSNGLVAKKEGPLPGGTIVSDIDENGGVAINIFGDVAFHGDIVDADAGTDKVRAVLVVLVSTQEELIVKEGDTLPDGTILDEITESGGVAMNFFGDVAFQGRTGGIKAVFTHNGLVAREGDTLADGTILDEIHQTAGVAINLDGDVAFHGKVGTIDAVFVGKAPVAEGADTSSE
jgi:hypothetical protein